MNFFVWVARKASRAECFYAWPGSTYGRVDCRQPAGPHGSSPTGRRFSGGRWPAMWACSGTCSPLGPARSSRRSRFQARRTYRRSFMNRIV